MPNKIYFIKNITHETPGHFESYVKKHDMDYRVVDHYLGEHLPHVAEDEAVVILGGPAGANDSSRQIDMLENFCKDILERNIPCLGICLGMQMLVKAGGGEVYAHNEPEVGLSDHEGKRYLVHLTEAGQKSVLFVGMTNPMQVFQLHQDTVKLAPGMVLLGEGESCKMQIVQVGPKQFGIQAHVELTEKLLTKWRAEDEFLKSFDEAELLADFNSHSGILAEEAHLLFHNFLKIADDHRDHPQ